MKTREEKLKKLLARLKSNIAKKTNKPTFPDITFKKPTREDLRKHIDDLRIKTPKHSKTKLIEKTIKNYNHIWRGRKKITKETLPKGFDRLMLNYLRHNNKDYTRILSFFRPPKVLDKQTYKQLKNKVELVMVKKYPFLKKAHLVNKNKH